jgi:hypothetical protein
VRKNKADSLAANRAPKRVEGKILDSGALAVRCTPQEQVLKAFGTPTRRRLVSKEQAFESFSFARLLTVSMAMQRYCNGLGEDRVLAK